MTEVYQSINTGSGFIRTASSSGLQALRLLEEEAARGRGSRLCLHASQEAALYVLNRKRAELADIEERYGVMIEVLSDGAPEGARMAVEASGPPPSHAPRLPQQIIAEPDDDEIFDEIEEEEVEEQVARPQNRERDEEEGEGDGRRRRRRRRRRGGQRDRVEGEQSADGAEDSAVEDDEVEGEAGEGEALDAQPAAAAEGDEGKRRGRRGRRGGRRRGGRDESAGEAGAIVETVADDAVSEVEAAPDGGAEPEAVVEPVAEQVEAASEKPAERNAGRAPSAVGLPLALGSIAARLISFANAPSMSRSIN